MRAGELLGRTAYDADGRRLGRIVDLVVRGELAPGRLRLTDVIVAGHWYSRLIGPERHPAGPWAIRMVARLLGRSVVQVPVGQIRLHPPVAGLPAPAAPGDRPPGAPHRPEV